MHKPFAFNLLAVADAYLDACSMLDRETDPERRKSLQAIIDQFKRTLGA